MKLLFILKKKAVRKSFSSELKKASWIMGAVFGAASIWSNKLEGLVASVLVWLVLQALAHVLLGMQDENEDNPGE